MTIEPILQRKETYVDTELDLQLQASVLEIISWLSHSWTNLYQPTNQPHDIMQCSIRNKRVA